MDSEKIQCLTYFEQRLRQSTTGANIHVVSNLLASIGMLKHLFEQDKMSPELNAIYIRISLKLENIYGCRYQK